MTIRVLVLVLALLAPTTVLAIGEDVSTAINRFFGRFLTGDIDAVLAMVTDDFYGRADPSIPLLGGEYFGVAGLADHLADIGHTLDVQKFEYDIESVDELRRTALVRVSEAGFARSSNKEYTITFNMLTTWSRETPARITRMIGSPEDAKSLKNALKTKAELVWDKMVQTFISGDIVTFKKQFSSKKFAMECHGEYPGCDTHDNIDSALASLADHWDWDMARSEVLHATDKQVVASLVYNHCVYKKSGKSMLTSDDDTMTVVMTLGDDGKIARYESTISTEPSPWAFQVPPPVGYEREL